MKKKQDLTIVALFLVVFILVSPVLAAAKVTAGPTHTPTPTPSPSATSTLTPRSNTASFSSQGVISYSLPTPTPTPSPSPINLTPIPTAWETATTGMYLAIGGAISVVLDTSVLYNGQSTIRIDGSDPNNSARECDGPYISVMPGDHIVYSVWMKTTASTTGGDGGARIGIDFYGDNGAISGTSAPNGAPAYTQAGGWATGTTYVAWNTNSWTLVKIDFVVKSQYEYSSNVVNNPNYSNGQLAVPTAIIPWMQVQPSNDGGKGWFANPILYINP